MARVPLERLEPGMRLTKAVSNPQGVLLLREGEILTDRHLQVFRAWRITEVEATLADGSEPAGVASAPGDAEAVCEIPPGIEEEITHRFRHAEVESDPVMAEIRGQAAIRLAMRTQARLTTAGGPVQEAV
jgi:hypothetical protein